MFCFVLWFVFFFFCFVCCNKTGIGHRISSKHNTFNKDSNKISKKYNKCFGRNRNNISTRITWFQIIILNKLMSLMSLCKSMNDVTMIVLESVFCLGFFIVWIINYVWYRFFIFIVAWNYLLLRFYFCCFLLFLMCHLFVDVVDLQKTRDTFFSVYFFF